MTDVVVEWITLLHNNAERQANSFPVKLKEDFIWVIADETEAPELAGAFFRPEQIPDDVPSAVCCCVIYRYLYLMALDGYRHGWADTLDQFLTEAPLVHSGALLVMLELLPGTLIPNYPVNPCYFPLIKILREFFIKPLDQIGSLLKMRT